MFEHRLQLQFRLRTLLALMTMAAVFIWPWWSIGRHVQPYREQVLAAENSLQAGLAYQEMFRNLPPRAVYHLTRDADASNALRAAFELKSERTSDYGPIKPKNAAAFLAFLKKRTGLTPPDWWIEQFPEKHYREAGDGGVTVLDPDGNPLDSGVQVAGGRVLLGPSLRSINSLERHILLETVSGRQRVPIDEFRSLYEQCGFAFKKTVIADLHRRHAAVGVHGAFSGSFPLGCYNRNTGRPKWRQFVWAEGGEYNAFTLGGAVPSHRAEITASDRLVVVWGAGWGGNYAEAFNADTGESAFRFSTELWNIKAALLAPANNKLMAQAWERLSAGLRK